MWRYEYHCSICHKAYEASANSPNKKPCIWRSRQTMTSKGQITHTVCSGVLTKVVVVPRG